jgi:7-cyano-7-deazaguanine synthase
MLKEEYKVRALTFEFAGIAASEIRAAKEVARAVGVAEHRLVRLPDLKEAQDIRGHAFGDLPPTYIPMRNGVFYFFAASYAEEVRAAVVAGGHNRDDTRIFRDVRPAFFSALQDAFWSGSKILKNQRTRIIRPLWRMTKFQVVRKASEIGVPLHLTWSCHRDGPRHCWECPGCLVRISSFKEAGVLDPLRPTLGRKIT